MNSIPRKINKFLFEIAREESYKSNYKPQKLGAVIEKGGKVLSKGYNQLRYCGKGIRYSQYIGALHAERDCIRKLDKDQLEGSTIYIYRETKSEDGKIITPNLSFPCEDCFALIKKVGIKRIVFTTNIYPYYSIAKVI